MTGPDVTPRRDIEELGRVLVPANFVRSMCNLVADQRTSSVLFSERGDPQTWPQFKGWPEGQQALFVLAFDVFTARERANADAMAKAETEAKRATEEAKRQEFERTLENVVTTLKIVGFSEEKTPERKSPTRPRVATTWSGAE